ncbi:uncharacterized protein [Procambarus clarkii]|uniref:uncharacterized protein isoform X2 n=1 Tax=Procambarus clarkii TaxID=6728 RepID=UPI0037434BD5
MLCYLFLMAILGEVTVGDPLSCPVVDDTGATLCCQSRPTDGAGKLAGGEECVQYLPRESLRLAKSALSKEEYLALEERFKETPKVDRSEDCCCREDRNLTLPVIATTPAGENFTVVQDIHGYMQPVLAGFCTQHTCSLPGPRSETVECFQKMKMQDLYAEDPLNSSVLRLVKALVPSGCQCRVSGKDPKSELETVTQEDDDAATTIITEGQSWEDLPSLFQISDISSWINQLFRSSPSLSEPSPNTHGNKLVTSSVATNGLAGGVTHDDEPAGDPVTTPHTVATDYTTHESDPYNLEMTRHKPTEDLEDSAYFTVGDFEQYLKNSDTVKTDKFIREDELSTKMPVNIAPLVLNAPNPSSPTPETRAMIVQMMNINIEKLKIIRDLVNMAHEKAPLPSLHVPDGADSSGEAAPLIVSKEGNWHKKLKMTDNIITERDNYDPLHISLSNKLKGHSVTLIANYILQEMWQDSSCTVPENIPQLSLTEDIAWASGVEDNMASLAGVLVTAICSCYRVDLHADLLDGTLAKIVMVSVKAATLVKDHLAQLDKVMQSVVGSVETQQSVALLRWASGRAVQRVPKVTTSPPPSTTGKKTKSKTSTLSTRKEVTSVTPSSSPGILKDERTEVFGTIGTANGTKTEGTNVTKEIYRSTETSMRRTTRGTEVKVNGTRDGSTTATTVETEAGNYEKKGAASMVDVVTGSTAGETGGIEGVTGSTEVVTGSTEGEIGGTEGEIGGTEGEIGGTEGVTGSTEGEIVGTEGEIVGTEGEIVGTEGEIVGTEGEIVGTEGEIVGTEGEIVGTEGEIVGTEGEIVGTEGEIVGTEGEIVGTEGEIVGTEGEIVGTEGEIVGTEGEIVGTEGEIVGTEGEIVGTEGEIVGTEGEIVGTEGEIVGTEGEIVGTEGEIVGTEGEIVGTEGEIVGTEGEIVGTEGEIVGTEGEIVGTEGEIVGTEGEIVGTEGEIVGTEGEIVGTEGEIVGTEGEIGGTEGVTGSTESETVTGSKEGETGGTAGETGNTESEIGGTEVVTWSTESETVTGSKEGETGGTAGETGGTAGEIGSTAGEIGSTAGETWSTAGETWSTAGETWSTAGETLFMDAVPWGMDVEPWGMDVEPWGMEVETWGMEGATGSTPAETGSTAVETGSTAVETGSTTGETWGMEGETWGMEGATGSTVPQPDWVAAAPATAWSTEDNRSTLTSSEVLHAEPLFTPTPRPRPTSMWTTIGKHNLEEYMPAPFGIDVLSQIMFSKLKN